MPAAVHVLGVRHHGPGSARAVRAALAELEPDAVLIEGPPEAEAVLALAADEAMRPPVALLVYVPDAPQRASFYPMAEFSPEWQAVRHGLATDTPVRFIDLPAQHGLAETDPEHADGREDGDPPLPVDPLGRLAAVAGHDDPERWWEDVVEHGDGALDVFAAVTEAMAALREDADPLPPREAQREAAMRRAIRRAEKDGFARIAVVCGAWHAPVLERATFPSAASDDALLRGLPKTKVAATWVPWTNDRLALRSGYGAGVRAPGWYHHLFTAPDQPIARWMQRAATLLRTEDLDASPASVVEAVRLAETLGTVRGRPRPGLSEVGDAALAVLAQGRELSLALIEQRLVVGDVLGEVPPSTPMVPLVEDLARLQRRLRLKPEASESVRELDLRKENDLARSHLLHRLTLLGVPWGVPAAAQTRSTGTFKETWQLRWEPEFAVSLIEAARYGGTVEAAALGVLAEVAATSQDMAQLTGIVEAALLAALPAGVALLMDAIAELAVRDADVGRLMDALAPLARVHRYGSVRQEDTSAVGAVFDGLVTRICVGLQAALAQLDDDAARETARRIDAADSAIGLLDDPDQREVWRATVRTISARTDVHALITGRTTRLLLDAGVVDADEARRRMGLELSRPADADRGAAWLEGFLSGSGLLLLHDAALLGLIDGWLASIPVERFDDVLPLLRRSFSAYAAGERRQIGQRVRHRDGFGGASASGTATATEPAGDPVRGERAVATILELLGEGA